MDEEGAQYPAKISYMYNPPHLAVEALEMYYRIHTSILKCVQRALGSSHLYKLYSQVSYYLGLFVCWFNVIYQ